MSDCMCPSNCGTDAITQPIPPPVTIEISDEESTMMGIMFDKLVNAFTMPAVDGTVAVVVANPDNYAVGMWVYIVGEGYLEVTAIGETTITLKNIGNSSNSAPGVTVAALTVIIPGFPKAAPDAPLQPTDRLTDPFTTVADQASVNIVLSDNSWVDAGMTLFIKGAGKLTVNSVSGDGVTVSVKNDKTKHSANAGASTVIPADTAVFAVDDAAYQLAALTPSDHLTASFVTVADQASVQIAISNNTWCKVDMTVFILGAGKLLITAVDAGGLLITVKNNKALHTKNAAAGVTIASGVSVFPCDTIPYADMPMARIKTLYSTVANGASNSLVLTDTSWVHLNMTLFVVTAGRLTVTAINVDGFTLTVKNDKTRYTQNAGAGTDVAVGLPVFPVTNEAF